MKMWNRLTKRDQMLLILIIYLVVGALVYFGGTKLGEKRDTLRAENAQLVQEETTVASLLASIPKLEGNLEETEKTLSEYYDSIQDNFDSPIAFERIFLGWLNNKSVNVVNMTVTEPTMTFLDMPTPDETNDLMDLNVAVLEGKEVDFDPEDEAKENNDENAEEELERSAFMVQYTYEVQMSSKLYNEVVDNMKDLSKFYQLKTSSYSYDTNTAQFVIDIYTYNKPEIYKRFDNLDYYVHYTDKFITKDDTTVTEEKPVEGQDDKPKVTEDEIDQQSSINGKGEIVNKDK